MTGVGAAALKMEWVQVLSGSGGLGGSAAAADAVCRN